MPLRGGAAASDAVADDARAHVRLRQGPIGPFFSELQDELERRDVRVTRVLFNAGDDLFARGRDTVRFSGDEGEWRAFITRRLADDRPDAILLFGRKRPAHRVAADLAAHAGVPLLSLEEGYLRSGFVTCEEGGNNDLSPIAGKVPDGPVEDAPLPFAIRPNFKTMNWIGFLYFTTRIIFSKSSDAYSFHRPLRGAITEAIHWLKNIFRLWTHEWREKGAIADLLEGRKGRYVLVPLQTPEDSQLKRAARGWTLDTLAREVMERFRGRDDLDHLVFKIHPLDAGGRGRAAELRAMAETFGIGDRVTVLHSGSIGQLSTHSVGMITINSTSGLSAIHHGTPLLVLGHAIYAHPSLAMVGEDAEAITRFFDERFSAPLADRRNYERFVAREALVAGDFYLADGRRIAVGNIADRLVARAQRG